MAAYWIAQVDITDPDAYGKYAALGTGVVESYGDFPSVENAERCYAADEYQAALSLAGDACARTKTPAAARTTT